MYPKHQGATEPVPQERTTTTDLHTGQLGSLTSGFRGEGAAEQRQYESIVSPAGYKKNPRVIRGERRLVSALPDPVVGLCKLLLPVAPVSGKN